MGSGGSVNKKPRSPYHRLCEAKIRKAKSMRCIDGDASDFYFLCANGETERVRQILEASDRQSINELVKLEPNGNTALHIATEQGHDQIVRLLLEHRASRIILNRTGKRASEEARTPEIQKLFHRDDNSDRFHGSDAKNSMVCCLLKTKETDATAKKTPEFVQCFKTKEEVKKYSLDHQTTAMWLRLFNWILRTFPSFFERQYLSVNAFNLYENVDFNDFLKNLGDKYEETRKEFDEARTKNSIDALLKIYSKEEIGFYRSLNKQLADSPQESNTSPHLCDRFIIEFHLRSDELAKRAFTGTTYRGSTVDSSELASYETVLSHKPPGCIGFKAFTSTSENPDIALNFISKKPPKKDEIGLLFIIETKVKSPTVIGMSDASDYEDEEEVLIMPGSLFTVEQIVKDVITSHTRTEKRIKVTEVYLKHLHVPVSTGKKLLHTYRSAVNSVTSTNVASEDNN